MPSFAVQSLSEVQLDLTFAIERVRSPGLDRRDWHRTIRRLARAGEVLGLFVAGELFGFTLYRVLDRSSGRTLELDHFTTIEVNAAAPGRRALCEAAEALARQLECRVVEIRIESARRSDRPGLAGWQALGHQSAATLLRKDVEAAPALRFEPWLAGFA